MQKLTQLSTYWSVHRKDETRWKKQVKAGLKPLEITKKELGIAFVEGAHSLQGDMKHDDADSEYFVN